MSRTYSSDGDLPVRASLRTADLDEAEAFCRRICYDSVRVTTATRDAVVDYVADGIRLGGLTVGEVRYGTAVTLTASDLEHAYHVLAPLSGAVESRQNGRVVIGHPGCAVVLQPVGHIRLVWTPDCRMLSVKVDRATLERELDAALDRQLASPVPLGPSFAIASGPGRSWAALVRLLMTEMRGPDGLFGQPQMARRLRDLVVSGLALSVEHPYAGEPPGRRPRTVKRALDAMNAAPAHPFTAAELAAVAGVGVRVLQESFKQHVGVPPLTYLRRLRLDGVRAELTRADPGQVSVAEVAARWGFSHLGRFAAAYRKRYGESPSHTLREAG